MELRHLRYFAGVAGELNFTRAARKLRVAQPALSRQIRQLEEEVGVALLDRGARGVTLTPAGREFLAEAKALLEQSELAVRRARLGGPAGRLHVDIGYVWGLFHSLVPRVIEAFRQTHPDTAVNLFDLPATGQAKALGEGRLDLGFIGFAQEADDARLEKARIGSCNFVAALPEKHPAARKPKVELERLAAEFFFVISAESFPGAAGFVVTACAEAGFRPKVLQTAERGHTILGLVAGNCGVAILPEPLRALPHPGVVFRPLARPITADLFVAWKPGNDYAPVTALRNAAIGQAGKH